MASINLTLLPNDVDSLNGQQFTEYSLNVQHRQHRKQFTEYSLNVLSAGSVNGVQGLHCSAVHCGVVQCKSVHCTTQNITVLHSYNQRGNLQKCIDADTD